jgi:hypothetical protein
MLFYLLKKEHFISLTKFMRVMPPLAQFYCTLDKKIHEYYCYLYEKKL